MHDLAELLGRMGVLEEGGRVSVDCRGLAGDEIAEIGGEDGIVEIALEDFLAGFAAGQDTHSPPSYSRNLLMHIELRLSART